MSCLDGRIVARAGQRVQQHGILCPTKRGSGWRGRNRSSAERRCKFREGSWGRCICRQSQRPDLPGRIRQPPGRRHADAAGYCVLDCLHDQGGDWRRRDAMCRAWQAVARPASRRNHARAGGTAGARRLRRRRQAVASPRPKEDHLAEPADPYSRLRLRCVERQAEALRRHDRFPARPLTHSGLARRAFGVRSGRGLGIRHQHRLGGPDGGNGLGPEPGYLHAREHICPAWHARQWFHSR